MGTGSRLGWLLSRILLLALSTLVAVMLSEVAVRWVVPIDMSIWRTTRDGLITLRPGLDTWLPSFGQVVQTNDLGFRDEPRARTKPDGSFRVVLVGDSFVEALQVSHEASLPHLLEEKLARRSTRPVEVLSAGVSGWGTDDELTWLRWQGFAFQPDLVLVAMTLHNDVSDNLELRHHEVVGGVLRPRPREEMAIGRFVELETKGWLASHSHLYRFVTGALRRPEVETRGHNLDRHVEGLLRREPDEEIARGWAWTDAYLDAIRDESDAVGAKMAVFLIPLAIQMSDESIATFLATHSLRPDEIDVDLPQQQMKKWGDGAGVEVIDLLPAFRSGAKAEGEVLYLPADGHWSGRGHRLAAEVVADELIRRGLVSSIEPHDP